MVFNEFLDRFLPCREENADEYYLPMYSDEPETIFRSVEELMRHCTGHPEVKHSIYWRRTKDRKPEQAMLFMRGDGHVIYGLSTEDSVMPFANQLPCELMEFLGTKLGFIVWESAPESSTLEEFQVRVNAYLSK